MPEVLSDVGVPIKDLSRMMSIQFPEKMTLGSILEAGGESVQRTAQLNGSQANPVLKTAFELATGKNLFFDRPITDKTIRKLPKLSEAAAQLMPYGYQKIPRAVGDFIDAVTWKWLNPVENGDGTVTVDPIGYTLLTDLFPPLARAVQSVKAAGKEGVPFDHKLLRLLTGAKINSLDFQKSGVYDRNRQLESFFEKRALPTSRRNLASSSETTLAMGMNSTRKPKTYWMRNNAYIAEVSTRTGKKSGMGDSYPQRGVSRRPEL